MGVELLNQIIRLADEHDQGRLRLVEDKEGKEKVEVYGNKGWFGKFRIALRNKDKMEEERIKLNEALDKSLVFDDRKNLVKNFLDNNNNKFLDCKTIRERVIKTTTPKESMSLYEIIDFTKKELTARGQCLFLIKEFLREADLPLPDNQVKSKKVTLRKMTPEEIEKLERFPLGHLGYKFTKKYYPTDTILVAMSQEEIDNYHQVMNRIDPLNENQKREREEIIKRYPYGDYRVKYVERNHPDQKGVIGVDLVEMTEEEINEYNEKTQRWREHRAWEEFKEQVLENRKIIEEYEQIKNKFPFHQDGWVDLTMDEKEQEEYNEKEARFLNLCRFDRSKIMGGTNSPSPMDENEKKEYLERFSEFKKLILKGEIIQPDENVIEEYMKLKEKFPDGYLGYKSMKMEISSYEDLEVMTEAEIKEYEEKRERFLRYRAQEEMGIVPMNEIEIEEYKSIKQRFPFVDLGLKSEIINYPDPTTKQLGLEELQKMQKAIGSPQNMLTPYLDRSKEKYLSEEIIQEEHGLFGVRRYQAITNCPAPYYDISILNPNEKKEYQEAMINPIIPYPDPKYRGYKIVNENNHKQEKDLKNDDYIYQITRIQSSWGEFQEFGSVNEINYKKRLQKVCRDRKYDDIPKFLLNNTKWKELKLLIACNIEKAAKEYFNQNKFSLSNQSAKEVAEETIRNFLLKNKLEKKKSDDGFEPLCFQDENNDNDGTNQSENFNEIQLENENDINEQQVPTKLPQKINLKYNSQFIPVENYRFESETDSGNNDQNYDFLPLDDYLIRNLKLTDNDLNDGLEFKDIKADSHRIQNDNIENQQNEYVDLVDFDFSDFETDRKDPKGIPVIMDNTTEIQDDEFELLDIFKNEDSENNDSNGTELSKNFENRFGLPSIETISLNPRLVTIVDQSIIQTFEQPKSYNVDNRLEFEEISSATPNTDLRSDPLKDFITQCTNRQKTESILCQKLKQYELETAEISGDELKKLREELNQGMASIKVPPKSVSWKDGFEVVDDKEKGVINEKKAKPIAEKIIGQFVKTLAIRIFLSQDSHFFDSLKDSFYLTPDILSFLSCFDDKKFLEAFSKNLALNEQFDIMSSIGQAIINSYATQFLRTKYHSIGENNLNKTKSKQLPETYLTHLGSVDSLLDKAATKYFINPSLDKKTKDALWQEIVQTVARVGYVDDDPDHFIVSLEGAEAIAERVIVNYYKREYFNDEFYETLPLRPTNITIDKNIFSLESFFQIWDSLGEKTKVINDPDTKISIFEEVCNELEKQGANQLEITEDWARQVSVRVIENNIDLLKKEL